MKKIIIILSAAVVLGLAGILALASDDKDLIDHSQHKGRKIHETHEQGYQLAYHLLDLPNNSFQHLMVYITDKDGAAVVSAKVGFLIKGPDGSEQKVMAMAMTESFGGNVNFQTKGTYKIITKAIIEEDKFLYNFLYEVK
jgi:hypothetical protein